MLSIYSKADVEGQKFGIVMQNRSLSIGEGVGG